MPPPPLFVRPFSQFQHFDSYSSFNFSLIECLLFIGLQKKSLRLSAFFNLLCACQLHYTHNHRYRRTNADAKIIALLWGVNSDYDRVHTWSTSNPNISCVKTAYISKYFPRQVIFCSNMIFVLHIIISLAVRTEARGNCCIISSVALWALSHWENNPDSIIMMSFHLETQI